LFLQAEFPLDREVPPYLLPTTIRAAWQSVVNSAYNLLKQYPGAFKLSLPPLLAISVAPSTEASHGPETGATSPKP
jgi:hypothetical protein